jgi:ElaB/YqjD/DUF883 family membrane-anchored ribosome-binding protein
MPDPSNPIRDTVRGTVRDVQEAARESSRAAAAAGNDIRADVDLLRSDVARLSNQIADIFSSKGSAKSNVEGVVSDVSAKGQEAVDAVREVGDNMVDAIDESLKNRPYTTLALAVGIGFLFGATWRR